MNNLPLRITIGADHRGFAMKQWLMSTLDQKSGPFTWLDVGTFKPERTDYPPFAQAAANHIVANEAMLGILICGTGVGMSIAANRFAGIYAALVWNNDIARRAREDDNANVLVIPADYVSNEEALAMIQAWLGATFKGGRYQERLTMIDAFSD
jgi:ribose 5-phosphate isomerase B